MEALRTDLQRERVKRDMAIYSEYEEMMSVEGQSATEVAKFLMKKYNIHSMSTVYVIRRRAEEQLKREGRA